MAPKVSPAAYPAPAIFPSAAVATDHPAASAAGLSALQAGGNAVDAACAATLALGVVNPVNSGIGGGGFAVVYLAKTAQVFALDFRETAPAGLEANLFFRDGKPDPRLSTESGLAVGVPGEVRGLATLVKRWGKRPFASCVGPAERLARTTPQDASDTISRRPALAQTLALLQRLGPDAFYKGAVADDIVATVKKTGGVLTKADLAAYAPKDRSPLAIDYRGYRIFTMPPPSSGGIVIAETLGILSARMKEPPTAPSARGGSAYLHVLTEAWKHGFADRARHLGDPDFVSLPTARLLDPAYHHTLAARIADAGVSPAAQYGSGDELAASPRDGGTAHVSVIDREGNAVALTTTTNLPFGSRIVTARTGILLNNQMDDFALAPDTPNAFGLLGGKKNAVAPGKRPLSSMSPTIVLEGNRVKMVVGAAGGPTIITSTLQVLLHVLDGKWDAQVANAAPRIHHQWMPHVLYYEGEMPVDVIHALEKRGHKTEARPSRARVNVVVRTAAGLEAASDLRSGGAPAGN